MVWSLALVCSPELTSPGGGRCRRDLWLARSAPQADSKGARCLERPESEPNDVASLSFRSDSIPSHLLCEGHGPHSRGGGEFQESRFRGEEPAEEETEETRSEKIK